VIEIRRHVETDWPIEQVATYLCDFTTTADWDPHTVRSSRRDSGPVRVGSEFDNVQKVGRVRSSSRYRVTELRPGRSITLRSSTRSVELTDILSFEPAASGGTDVTYVAKVKFKGLAKAGESFMRALLNKIGDDGAAGMSRVLGHLGSSTHSVA
jgi:carbon monoxide dehydrogenase subunit G